MHHGLSLVTAPTSEPVTREEAKKWCKVEPDVADDDDVFDAVIAGARRYVENKIEKALFTQTWKLTLDYFPPIIYLPRPPLASVSSVVYVDTGGTSTTLATTEYQVDTTCEPGRVTAAYGKSWPSTRDQLAAVTITYVAGKTVVNIESDTKVALRLLISHWYTNRDAMVVGTISSKLEFAVDAILGLNEVGSYG